jgi:hypothetical protein
MNEVKEGKGKISEKERRNIQQRQRALNAIPTRSLLLTIKRDEVGSFTRKRPREQDDAEEKGVWMKIMDEKNDLSNV